jgi:hypothetical protein
MASLLCCQSEDSGVVLPYPKREDRSITAACSAQVHQRGEPEKARCLEIVLVGRRSLLSKSCWFLSSSAPEEQTTSQGAAANFLAWRPPRIGRIARITTVSAAVHSFDLDYDPEEFCFSRKFLAAKERKEHLEQRAIANSRQWT